MTAQQTTPDQKAALRRFLPLAVGLALLTVEVTGCGLNPDYTPRASAQPTTAVAELSPTSVLVTTQTPTSTRTPLTPSHTQTPMSTLVPLTHTPTPTPGPLTDVEAVARVKEELTNRGVSLDTVRITISGKPRKASIRYTSSYKVDSNVFKAQTMLVALAAARVVVRVHPPINGGMRLGVMPAGESDVGLQVTIIDGSSLQAWASGSLTDQEFVSQWSGGIVTRE